MTAPELESAPSVHDDTTIPGGRQTIVLHDFGDVTLLVGTGETQQPVLTSSSTLRLASPVWRAMFGQRWAESESSEVPFPDDDVEAMLLVLRIAHLRFQELPQKHGISFNSLLNLAFVCDKYDLVRMVRPFLDLHCWAQPFLHMTDPKTCQPAWLFIAWTFGYSESFDALAKRLVRAVATSDMDGRTIVGVTGGPELQAGTLPPDILGVQPLFHDQYELLSRSICRYWDLYGEGNNMQSLCYSVLYMLSRLLCSVH